MSTPTPEPNDTRPPEDPLAEHALRQAARRFERGRRAPRSAPALLSERVRRIYDLHQRRAAKAGAVPDYRPDDLLRLIQRRLAECCPYCRQTLTAASVAVTHKNPPPRGGRHALANLVVCCKTCRAVKGPLDGQEFRELLLVMCGWPEVVRRLFLSRLRHTDRAPPDRPRAA